MRIVRRVGLCLWTEEDCSWHMLRCVPMFHNKCIQTWKASCKSEPNDGLPPMQKALQEVALFNYKQRGTLPRHHAKAQLIPWAGQHIGTAGTSSIHLFSNYTLIQCTKALCNPPHLFTIYLTHGNPFAFLQRTIGDFSYTFLLGINFIKGDAF